MRSDIRSWQHSLARSSLRAWIVTAVLVLFGAVYGLLSSSYEDNWLAVVCVSVAGLAIGISAAGWIERRVFRTSTLLVQTHALAATFMSPGITGAFKSNQEYQQPGSIVVWGRLVGAAQTQQSNVGLAMLVRGQERQASATNMALAS